MVASASIDSCRPLNTTSRIAFMCIRWNLRVQIILQRTLTLESRP